MSKNYQNALDTEIYRITIGIISYRIILNILNYQIFLNSDNKINHKFWIYEITLEMRNYKNALNNLNYWITLEISNYLSFLIRNYQIVHHFHKLQIDWNSVNDDRKLRSDSSDLGESNGAEGDLPHAATAVDRSSKIREFPGGCSRPRQRPRWSW